MSSEGGSAPRPITAFALDGVEPSNAPSAHSEPKNKRLNLNVNPASLSPASVQGPPGTSTSSRFSPPSISTPIASSSPLSLPSVALSPSPISQPRGRAGSFLVGGSRSRAGSLLAPRGSRMRAGSISSVGARQRASSFSMAPVLINAGRPRNIFHIPPEYDQSDSLEYRQYLQAKKTPLVSSKSSLVDSLAVDEHGEQISKPPDEEKLYNFVEIVDIDEEEAHENYVNEDLIGKLLGSWQFRAFIIFVIVINSILIGLQTDRDIEAQFIGAFAVIDSIILTIFVVEILLKWYHGFWTFWFVGWNVFDFFIVAISLLGPSVTFLSSSRVLRLFRVLRAFRTLRSISALQGLQVIVRTLLKSLPDVGNIILLLLILMFVFSVVGVSLFAADAPPYFGNLGVNMYTLFILMTQDGWVRVFDMLKVTDSLIFAAIYFILFIFLGAFVFVNVIVGVTVTNLQSAYAEIKRVRRAKHRLLKVQRQEQGGGGGGEGGGSGENSSNSNSKSNMKYTRSVIPAPNVGPEIWNKQLPLETPDPSMASIAALERYFLVLSAMEDNLAEHLRLKEKIVSITDEVKELNRSLRGVEVGDWSSESDNDSVEDEGDVQPRGDVLTEMMRRQAPERQAQPTASAMAQSLQKRRAMFGVLQEEQTRTERARAWAAGPQNQGDEIESTYDDYSPSLSEKDKDKEREKTVTFGVVDSAAGAGVSASAADVPAASAIRSPSEGEGSARMPYPPPKIRIAEGPPVRSILRRGQTSPVLPLPTGSGSASVSGIGKVFARMRNRIVSSSSDEPDNHSEQQDRDRDRQRDVPMVKIDSVPPTTPVRGATMSDVGGFGRSVSPGRTGLQRASFDATTSVGSGLGEHRVASFSLTRAMAAVNEEDMEVERGRRVAAAAESRRMKKSSSRRSLARGSTLSVLPLPSHSPSTSNSPTSSPSSLSTVPFNTLRSGSSGDDALALGSSSKQRLEVGRRSRSSGSGSGSGLTLDLSTTADGSPRRGYGRSSSPGGSGARSAIIQGAEMLTMGIEVGPEGSMGVQRSQSQSASQSIPMTLSSSISRSSVEESKPVVTYVGSIPSLQVPSSSTATEAQAVPSIDVDES